MVKAQQLLRGSFAISSIAMKQILIRCTFDLFVSRTHASIVRFPLPSDFGGCKQQVMPTWAIEGTF